MSAQAGGNDGDQTVIGKTECAAPVGAVLGEGPLWDPRIERLIFLDIKGARIFIFDPETRVCETIAAEGMVSAVGLAEKGGYICARRDGFARLSLDNGEARFEALIDPETDKPGNRFNDGKVDAKGGFWAGTMSNAEKEITGAWWRLSPALDAAKLDAPAHVPNGPAFDAARGRVYITDSAAQTIFAADSDGASLSGKKPFLQFGAGDGYPDGMDIDREGCLWVAFWDGACVRRFSPEGKLLETAPVGANRPTSVKLVEDRLYITSARIGLDAAQLAAAPLSGGLFEARLQRPLGEAHPRYFTG